jgi:ketosteroid isomerase-like protein
MNRTFLVGGAISVLFLTSTWSETLSPDAGGITAVVHRFHDALRRGDAQAVMELLAPDAIILEGGAIETRAEYESHHLAADMAFAKAVPSTRSDVRVQIDGNTAWLTSTSRTKGSFGGREINSTGSELIVLSKSAQGWRIRAIHWSSHDSKKSE